MFHLSAYGVLAVVSNCCPPPKGRFSRVTHPSATKYRSTPFDLHVLSRPPAFILSQDQTLRVSSNLSNLSPKNSSPFVFLYPVTRFDSVSQSQKPHIYVKLTPSKPRLFLLRVIAFVLFWLSNYFLVRFGLPQSGRLSLPFPQALNQYIYTNTLLSIPKPKSVKPNHINHYSRF
jgi:hypothetical protein